MQATTCFHDGIANAVLQEADLVFHQPIAFHPTDRVFNADSDRCNGTIRRFLLWREVTATRFFCGLNARDPITCIALEPQILIETTATWEGIAFQIRQAFIMRLPCRGGTQEANGTGLIDPYHHAKKGGGRLRFRLVSREAGGSFISRACGKQVLVSYRPIQYRMEPMNPRIRIRLGHPKALALHFRHGMRFQLGQHEEPLVSHRR